MATTEDSKPSDAPSAEAGTSRRKLITLMTHGLGALLTAVIATGPIAMALDPLIRRKKAAKEGDEGFSRVGSVGRFAVGGAPVRVVLKEDRQDAWLSQPGVPVGSVLVQRTAEAEFRVFSATCPHLGCAVNYIGSDKRFGCPCHRSSFGLDGAKQEPTADGKANPSPRGLDPLEWRIEGGQLAIKWERFQTGTADRVKV